MKKIMFNDKYGLTKAVLEGRKTMTRRVANFNPADSPLVSFNVLPYNEVSESVVIQRLWRGSYNTSHHLTPKFKVGEVVAVAQSYKEVGIPEHCMVVRNGKLCDANATGGWTNKMFVHPDHMKHFVRITNVRVERLQDISDEDCKKEGIDYVGGYSESYYFGHGVGNIRLGNSPREAYATLIDKVSGKGTWQANPYCFCYTFELIR